MSIIPIFSLLRPFVGISRRPSFSLKHCAFFELRSLLRCSHIGFILSWSDSLCSFSATSSIFMVFHLFCMMSIVPVRPYFSLCISFSVLSFRWNALSLLSYDDLRQSLFSGGGRVCIYQSIYSRMLALSAFPPCASFVSFAPCCLFDIPIIGCLAYAILFLFRAMYLAACRRATIVF